MAGRITDVPGGAAAEGIDRVQTGTSPDSETTGEITSEVDGYVLGSGDFWDVGDMTRPKGCPRDDGSGMTWGFNKKARKLVMIDGGHTPAERTGGFLGGKDCTGLSKRISASVSASVLAAFAEGRRNQEGTR